MNVGVDPVLKGGGADKSWRVGRRRLDEVHGGTADTTARLELCGLTSSEDDTSTRKAPGGRGSGR